MAVASLDDRFINLNQCLKDNSDVLYVEGLLDAVLAVYNDCNHPTLHRNKNLETFRKRYESSVPTLTTNRISPTDFNVIQVIGRGAFGEVQLVRMKETKKLYAMKILSKYEMIRRSDTAFFWEERDIMAYTKSAWIVQLHYAFQDKENLYMVMDYMAGGNMVSLMERYEIPESWSQFYVAELVLALDAVHKMGYVHRDVKPENMLMDSRGHLKLADFGTCMKLDAKGKVRSETAVGTPDYISPEVLKSQGGEGYYGVECDWWSVGVVTYEMLVGDLPFFSESLMGTYSNIMNHKNTLQFKDAENITVSAKKLITQLLEDSDHRLRIDDIRNHTFFKTDQWSWDNIDKCIAPVQPDLVSETDTQYFDEIEDSNAHQSFAAPVEFQGNHLPFVGFTFLKEKNIIDISNTAIVPDTSGQIVSDKVDKDIAALETAHQELISSYELLAEKYRASQEETKNDKLFIKQTTQKLNEAKKDLGIAGIDIKEAKRINEEIVEAKKMLEIRCTTLETQLDRNKGVESPTKLLSEVERLKEQIQSETDNGTVLKGQNRELRKELDLKKGMVERLEGRCRNLTIDKEQQESILEDLKCQNTKERTERDALNNDLNKQINEKDEVIVTTKTKLSTVVDEIQTIKNTQAEKDKATIMLKNSLQTLQQRYDSLQKSHEQMVQKTDEERIKMSSTKDYKIQIMEESEARQEAEDKIGSLQHRSSLLELDLEHKTNEMTTLMGTIKELECKLDNEVKRRIDIEQKSKKMEEEHANKLSQREQEMRSQINEMKTVRQNHDDTIYRLKSEIQLSEQSVRETRQELEEEQKQKNIIKSKLAELQNRTEGEGNDKELARQRTQISELNAKLTHAIHTKAMAESKLADFEKEKMMIELDVKETIARHKTEVTERMAWAAKIKEQLMIAEAKLNQKNAENNNLQDNLSRALMNLEKYVKAEENQGDDLKRLHHQLETERVLKKEAVNKLTQVMFQRQPQVKGGGPQKPEPRKSHEREIRKLKGELQQETQKYKRVVEKYQQQLEEIQRQIIEESHMRKELQTQLQQSESKLKSVQQGIGSSNYVLRGPSTETDGLGATPNIAAIQERETLTMQVPKGNDARKKGWRDVYVVLSYVAKKLFLYEREEDMGTDAPPYLMLEFGQIYSVRTLGQGEHERVRVKPNDAKRVIQLAYEEEESIRAKISPADEFEGVVQIRGHHFVEARNSSRSSCDVCGKTLPLALLSGGIFECKGCQMKCHKDDIEKVDLIQPCVAGEENQKKLLLLIKSDDNRSFWLTKLMGLTVGLAITTTTVSRTTSPNLVAPPTSKHRDRGGSVRSVGGSGRFTNKRPSSAISQQKPLASSSGPPPTNSHRRQLSKDSPLMGSNRQIDIVRNMDQDNNNARSQ